MTIQERIKQIRDNLSQSDFGKRIGASQRAVQGWESGESAPGASFLEAIRREFSIDLNWLLTGEGEPYLAAGGKPNFLKKPAETSRKILQDELADQFQYLPKAKAKLSAGNGNVVYSEQFHRYYAFRKDWLHWVSTSPANCILMGVQGDSMNPTLQEGDLVMLDIGRKDLVAGRIYAFNPGDDTIQVKRLEPRGATVRIISDNKQIYEPYEIPYESIRIIGQIIWFSRLLNGKED